MSADSKTQILIEWKIDLKTNRPIPSYLQFTQEERDRINDALSKPEPERVKPPRPEPKEPTRTLRPAPKYTKHRKFSGRGD